MKYVYPSMTQIVIDPRILVYIRPNNSLDLLLFLLKRYLTILHNRQLLHVSYDS